MTLVLDASVTLAWYFEDEESDVSEMAFDTVVESGAVVPGLWFFEVANGLQIAARGNRIPGSYRDESLLDLRKLSIAIDRDSEANAWGAGVALADRHRLTLYDAAYLELAQRRRLPLATLDKALQRAAHAEGIAMIGAAGASR